MAASDGAAALEISELEPRHAEEVAPLSAEAGWNQIAEDWRLMLEQGRAFGIRAASGRWIATSLVLPLGPAIAWISMVLVTEPARRQGLGTRLLNRCLADIERSGAAAGLDATEFGRPVYKLLGFADVYPLSRWRLEPGARRPIDPPEGVRVRPATTLDLPRIIDCDQARSGFARAAILDHLQARQPALAHVAERPDGRLVGFVLGRQGRSATHVGPVVADDEAVGLALLGSAVGRIQERVIVDVPDQHLRIRHWLVTEGGSAPRTFTRMLRGNYPPVRDATHVFALAGPELA